MSNAAKMKKCKLGELLAVKHGWAFKGEFFEETGEQCILEIILRSICVRRVI